MKKRWFSDRLTKNHVQRILSWGDSLSRKQEYNWTKRDSQVYLLLMTLLSKYFSEQGYEYRDKKKE